MLPLRFFRVPTFAGAQIAAFAISASIFASFLYITLYIQNVLGYSPLEAAVRFLPVTIAAFVISPLSSVAVDRIPPRILLFAGLGIIAIGMVLMAGAKEGNAWTAILPGLVLGGIGIGVVNPVLANIALSTVPEAQSGVASGVNDTFRQVGIAAGTAALGAAFLARAQTRITELLPSVGGAGARGLANGETLGGLQRDVSAQAVAAARQGFYAGLGELFTICAVVSAIGAVLALVLVRGQDMLHHNEEADIRAAA
jgi:predicted MFS family arabinose efflux permease